jgi:fatty-acyl-CoA synthase
MTTRNQAHSPPAAPSYRRGDTAVPLPAETIGDALRAAAAAAPERVGVVEGAPGSGPRRQLTFAELLDRSTRVAGALQTRFRLGERVALWAANSLDWIVFAHAAALAGVVLVPVNPAYRAAELAYVLRQSRSVGLVHAATPGAAAVVAAMRANLPDLREVHGLDAVAAAAGPQRAPREVSPAADAQIHYTSGTTAAPKGVQLRHAALVADARLAWDRLGGRAGDVAVWATPLFLPVACGLGMLGALSAGATFIFPTVVDPALHLELLDTCRATIAFAPPVLLAALLDEAGRSSRDLRALRVFGTGGSAVPSGLVEQGERRLGVPLSAVFAAAECSPVVTATRPDDTPHVRTTTAGSALPHTEVLIADPATGQPVPLGTVGELRVRGYQVMRGYVDDADATAAVIDADGWYHTRDLAAMDDAGNIRLEGRLTDVIVRGGERISPREIEDVLATHPAVAEVAVVGRPDERWGETVAAFVRPAPGTAPTEVELHTWCRRTLAGYKTPLRWLFVDAMPVTAAGTVRRNVLRARLRM